VKNIISGAVLTTALSVIFAAPAAAQRYDDQRYEPSQYEHCQDRAERRSGYYGDVPDWYMDGGAFRGAAKSANTVGAIAWLAGGSKKEIRRARKKAAAHGALEGAIKRAIAKDKQRKKRKEYDYEMQRCMNRRR
jgi:hypothetical protein